MKCVAKFSFDSTFSLLISKGILALYKGATPPAVGWAAIDSVLMGSLHNYRLFLLRNDMTEPTPGSGAPRLTLFAHGVAGMFAGLTRCVTAMHDFCVFLNRVVLLSQRQSSISKVDSA